ELFCGYPNAGKPDDHSRAVYLAYQHLVAELYGDLYAGTRRQYPQRALATGAYRNRRPEPARYDRQRGRRYYRRYGRYLYARAGIQLRRFYQRQHLCRAVYY